MPEIFRRTRVRLTLIYVAAFALVAATTAVAFWFVFAYFEYGPIDASLRAQAQVVQSGLEESNGQVRFARGEPLPGETQEGIAVAAVLVAPDGTILDQSGPLPDPQALAVIARHTPDSGFRSVNIAGHPERVLVQHLDVGQGATATLILARPVSELNETLLRMAILLVAVVAGLVFGASTLGYWLAGRALRPVGVMSATAREISEHDLHRRIDLDLPAGDELGELAATFNAMLARLESAFEGLQRFTADAAHELRAPLALMRTQVDVMLRHERSPQEYRASHRTLLAEVERLSRLAEQLLLLARSDAGALAPEADVLDVPALLEEVVERWRPVARDREVRLETELPLQGTLTGDESLLRRLFDNLFDNALRHTLSGGRVHLSAIREGEYWKIVVQDTGPGVDPALRARLFERFTRADAARGRDTGGAGLGLSLCAAIVRSHGGSVALEESRDRRGACLVVRLLADERHA